MVPNCKWCKLGECWTHQSSNQSTNVMSLMRAMLDKFAGGAEAEHEAEAAETSAVPRKSSAVQAFKSGKLRDGPYSQAPGVNTAAQSQGIGSSSLIGKLLSSVTPSNPFKRVFLPKKKYAVEEVAAAREALDIVVDGDNVESEHPPVDTFEELASVLPSYVFSALASMDISSPMPIQSQALPIVLGGNNVVGVARTGSGKTLAYLIPAVVHIEAQEPLHPPNAVSPIALCLAPTRELAVQISEEAQKLLSTSSEEGSSHPQGLWAGCIYGGMNRHHQLSSAAGAHIIAATPGRFVDHMQKGEIKMSRVTYFVLDEGDRMLDDGFGSEVEAIGSAIREDRQMLFFSATWPKKVQDLARKMCQHGKTPVRMRIGQNLDGGATTRQDILQEVVVFDDPDWDTRDAQKQELLYAHVGEALGLEGTQVLVFVSRKDLCQTMVQHFADNGIEAETLHGGRGQELRLRILESFKKREIRLLVTTDVMGRGLDIPSISHVVIYDMGDVDDYVHRVGRTCRGPYGQGHALTLFEYNNKWPHLAEGLIKVLENSGQEIPAELQQIADDVTNGKREVKAMKAGSKWGQLSGWQGGHDKVAWKKLGYGGESSNGAPEWQPW